MAIVRLNSSLTAIRGRIGDVVFKTYRDKVVVTRVPRFDGYIAGAAQRAHRDRMKAATAYAQRVYADSAAKTIYTRVAKACGRQPFRLAIADYLSAPTVNAIDLSRYAASDRNVLRRVLGIQARPRATPPRATQKWSQKRSVTAEMRPVVGGRRGDRSAHRRGDRVETRRHMGARPGRSRLASLGPSTPFSTARKRSYNVWAER